MKIIEETIAPAGSKRIVFALGLDELKLISGLIEKACRVFPVGDDWTPDGRRLSNMNKTLRKYFKEL